MIVHSLRRNEGAHRRRNPALDLDALRDLPDRVGVVVSIQPGAFNVTFRKARHGVWVGCRQPFGQVEVTRGDCAGTGTIVFTQVDDGWGPLLYDVAMEVATAVYGGLTPDRAEVSGEAEAIWRYYATRRTDVTARPLPEFTERCPAQFGRPVLNSIYAKRPDRLVALYRASLLVAGGAPDALADILREALGREPRLMGLR